MKTFMLPRALISKEDVLCLAKWAHGRKELVEIGVFMGGSACVLRHVMSAKGNLHLVDPFGPEGMPEPAMIGNLDTAKDNVALVPRGKVHFYFDQSHNVAPKFDTQIDFLFIDGDHRRAAVQQDWEDWTPKLIPGGIAILHDTNKCASHIKGPNIIANGLKKNPDFKEMDSMGLCTVYKKVKKVEVPKVTAEPKLS